MARALAPAAAAPEPPMPSLTPAPRTVVTGGTRGIGAAVAGRLAAAGHDIIALGRAPGHPTRPAAGGVRVDHADVADPAALASAFARANADGAGLTGLVASAGIWEPSPIEADPVVAASAHERIFRVNVLGVVNAVSSFLAQRRTGSHASIVLIGSTAGQRGEAGHGAYAASKAALMGLCKTWAVELAPRGVRVNVMAPGWVDTEMSAAALGDPERRSAIERSIPRGRVATAEECAGPVAFLLSDDSLHVTGSVLSVNGGGVLASY
jgi:3-oxoacyl-[acyl-carrier protein] reductase